MPDEGLHEFELKGKQLVFLFMAATVASVVIFLCGVMVGRGLRAPGAGDAPVLVEQLTVDPTAVIESSRSRRPDGVPVSAQESLTYDERLEAPRPIAERVAPADPPANVPEPPVEPLPPDPPDAPPAQSPGDDLAEPPGDGYVVQVMASTTRTEAEAVAQKLDAKGYPAFVSTVDGASRYRFRVRVGKFNDLRAAESAAARLRQEEQFNTWITR